MIARSGVRRSWLISISPRLVLVWLVLGGGAPASAQRARGLIEDLIRKTAKVPDTVPLRAADDLIKDVGRTKAAREVIEAEIREAGKAGKAGGAVKKLSREEEVFRLLERATKNVDPSLLKRLEQLDEGSREVALVIAKGGEQVQRSLPDIAARGRLLAAGGGETVAAIGVHGPEAAKAAMRLEAAIQAGSVVARDGARAVSLADFGRVMIQYGDASWTFWKTHIQPHWKVWLPSGALAAYLAAPEMFQDAAGGLTEAGFRRLTELAGATAAGAIRGVGQGAANSVDKTVEALSETVWSETRGRSTKIGLAVLAAVVIALVFWIRLRAWRARRRSSAPAVEKPASNTTLT